MRFIKFFVLLIVVSAIFSFVGCATQDTLAPVERASKAPVERASKPSTAKTLVLDYNRPDSEFFVPEFNVLASEFADEYSGKYVVVDGFYQGHGCGDAIVGKYSYDDMCWMFVVDSKLGQKRIKAVWPTVEKEFTRPLINMKYGDRIRIFAYVLPANQSLTLRNSNKTRGFSALSIFLLRVAPPDQINLTKPSLNKRREGFVVINYNLNLKG